MPSFRNVAAALALAAAVSAQSFAQGGPGRFPCSTRDANTNVVTPDPTQCTNAAMTANQAVRTLSSHALREDLRADGLLIVPT